MELRRILMSNKGFTLIEILVVIGILVAIISLGMVIDFSSFTGGNFNTEEAKIVAILQKARSRAMANVNESKHGACYGDGEYIIFEGADYGSASNEESIPQGLSLSLASTNFDCDDGGIIFEQLTGNTDTDTIQLTYEARTADIELNDEGRINW